MKRKSDRKVLVIGDTMIEAGHKVMLKLPVGRLPSGNRIFIHVHIYKAPLPGPVILLIAGIHGDEINGVEIARRISTPSSINQIKKGCLIVIPLLNVFGFIFFKREVSDGKDVNRSFPGQPTGSMASRIAAKLTKTIMPHVDVLIDFHTGGGHRYNYPQIRYSKSDRQSKKLAAVFAAPFSIESKEKPKSLRQHAYKMDIPSLTFEGGEAERFDGFSIQKALEGVQRILHHYSMAEDALVPTHSCIDLKQSFWIRAPQSGIFIWHRSSGVFINKGEILGIITDPDNAKSEPIKSKSSGYIIGHTNAPLVTIGDALFHIGIISG